MTTPVVNPVSGSEIGLIEHLRSFLHLTNQAPLEYVCKSALYLLTNVPSTRYAVFEYIGTLYRVATFLHLRFNLSQKNPNNTDLTTEITNINHINQVIELVENSLVDLVAKSKNNDIWSIEITQSTIELVGNIVVNTGAGFADTPGLTPEETISFKSPTIVDGLDIWANQCKPTQSLLAILQKCFVLVPKQTQLQIVDQILNTSIKYSTKFDWVLCYFSSLEAQMIFEKCLAFGIKETQIDNQTQKLSRVNVINFYGVNYSSMVQREISQLISKNLTSSDDRKRQIIAFLLRLASQSPVILNLGLNNILNNSFNYDLNEFVRLLSIFLVYNDKIIISELFSCIRQFNNSVAVFDMISSILEWLKSQSQIIDYEHDQNSIDFHKKIQLIIVSFLDELITNIYVINSENSHENNGISSVKASDSVLFLKNLLSINGTSLTLLIDQLFSIIKSKINSEILSLENDLIFKLIVLLCINGNDYISNTIMSKLMLIDNRNTKVRNSKNEIEINFVSSAAEEPMLIRIRQELNPFHPNSLRESIFSIINSFYNLKICDREEFEIQVKYFVDNLLMIYEWDLQNQYFMSENISSILIEAECFKGLIQLLDFSDTVNYSLAIMSLYNRLLDSEEEDFNQLKVSTNDLITYMEKFISYFFKLCLTINDLNANERISELVELLRLIENTINHICKDDSNPYRNMLARILIDKLFEQCLKVNKPSLKIPFNEIDENAFETDIDENSNLFQSNVDLVNSQALFQKSKLKAVRNSLVEHPMHKKLFVQMNQSKCITNLAFISLLDIVCSKEIIKEKNNSLDWDSPISDQLLLKKEIANDPLCYIADLLVQHIMLDDYYIDYPWLPNVDVDESYEIEAEAMKLFIERDVNVQKMVENVSNNQILWMILEYLAPDEQAFIKMSPIIRGLLASMIVQWDSFQEQSTRNVPKYLGITLRLLNLINRSNNFLLKPFCYIVDIVPLLNSYETHLCLLIIWKNLKRKMNSILKPISSSNNNNIVLFNNTDRDLKQLKYIFQKNISKLSHLYAKFFQL